MTPPSLSRDEIQQPRSGEDIAVERQLLGLQVTGPAMTTPNPGDVSLRDRLVRFVVDALPFEVHVLSAKHHDRPAHGHARLRDQRPPMLLPLALLRQSVERALLAHVEELVAILRRHDVRASATKRLAMSPPRFHFLSLDP